MPTLRQQKLVRINKLLAQSTNFSRREIDKLIDEQRVCLLYTSPSPRDSDQSRMPSSA